MCCGDNVKDDHGPLKEENAFRVDGHDGGKKVEVHHDGGDGGVKVESIRVGGGHSGVKVVTSSGGQKPHKRVMEEKVVVVVDKDGHKKETVVVVEKVSEELGHDFHPSWKQLKNHEKFPKDHVYYHERIENMRDMKSVHFEDANGLSAYISQVKHHTANQAAHLELSDISDKHMDAFVDIISRHNKFSDLALNCYENRNLSHKHFEGLTNAIHQQEHLRKVNVNLRWNN